MIFDVVAAHWQRGPVVESIAAAAAELGTMAVMPRATTAVGRGGPMGTSSHCLTRKTMS